jgi:hypothetical protein
MKAVPLMVEIAVSRVFGPTLAAAAVPPLPGAPLAPVASASPECSLLFTLETRRDCEREADVPFGLLATLIALTPVALPAAKLNFFCLTSAACAAWSGAKEHLG